MSKIIGIDFGTKKVGLAITDENQKIAFPVDVVGRADVLQNILLIAQKEKVKEIVLGESTQLNMEDNPVMENIRKFAKELENNGFKVHYHNEFMSSMQASRIQGYNKKQDASAAAIVLQNYIDTKND